MENNSDWYRWMILATQALHLSPKAFWELTPCELTGMLRALVREPAQAITKEELELLKRRFPDQKSSAEPL